MTTTHTKTEPLTPHQQIVEALKRCIPVLAKALPYLPKEDREDADELADLIVRLTEAKERCIYKDQRRRRCKATDTHPLYIGDTLHYYCIEHLIEIIDDTKHVMPIVVHFCCRNCGVDNLQS